MRIGRALICEAIFLAYQGNVKKNRAFDVIEKASTLSTKTNSKYLKTAVLASKGAIHYFSGDFVEAKKYLLEAEKQWRDSKEIAIWELNFTRILGLGSLRYLGEFLALKWMSRAFSRDSQQRGDLSGQKNIDLTASTIAILYNHEDLVQRSLADLSPPKFASLQQYYTLRARCELALHSGKPYEGIFHLSRDFSSIQHSTLFRIPTIRYELNFLWALLHLRNARREDPKTLKVPHAIATILTC